MSAIDTAERVRDAALEASGAGTGSRHRSIPDERRITPPTQREGGAATRQALAIELDGVTAGDYLSWVRDPEPPALDRVLRSVDICADPLGSKIDVDLMWDGPAPPPYEAAATAGLPATADVSSIRERTHPAGHMVFGGPECSDQPRRRGVRSPGLRRQ